MLQKLAELEEKLNKKGLKQEASFIKDVIAKAKSKRQKIREKYVTDKGDYKGGKGTAFDNCVKEKLELHEKGIKKLKTKEYGRTPEEAAEALCAFIGRKSGHI